MGRGVNRPNRRSSTRHKAGRRPCSPAAVEPMREYPEQREKNQAGPDSVTARPDLPPLHLGGVSARRKRLGHFATASLHIAEIDCPPLNHCASPSISFHNRSIPKARLLPPAQMFFQTLAERILQSLQTSFTFWAKLLIIMRMPIPEELLPQRLSYVGGSCLRAGRRKEWLNS